jgi:hypothetical protein
MARGDVAMIRLTGGMTSAALIYRGPPGSNTVSVVKAMWERSPVFGDAYITGGVTTGEITGGTVQYVGVNRQVFCCPFKWVRNIVDGTQPSSIQNGDSGGSVFTITTGGVKAKGIISARGLCTIGCPTWWTDIRVSYFGLPGFLRTG